MKQRTRSVGRYVFLASLTVLAVSLAVGSYGYEWEKTFGGSGYDCGKTVQQTADGGYIIVGATESFGAGECDLYLVRTDASGTELWSRSFGGIDWDEGISVQETLDGGTIVVGYITQPNMGGDRDVWLIRTDSEGMELWNKTFGGSHDDVGFSVQLTADHGYILAGVTASFGTGESDVYLIKTDGSGNEIWSQTFGGSGRDQGLDVQQTTDGGYIIAGTTWPLGGDDSDVYLIKTDGSGNELWTKTFGGEDTDYGFSVQQTEDGGYVIAGETWSFGAGDWDVYLIKTDGSGNEIWSRTLGGSDTDRGYSVQQSEDGGYIIAGGTESFGAGSADVYLVKTDASGYEVWSETFGGERHDCAGSVRQTTDGGYIVSGYTYSFGVGEGDAYLIYYDPEIDAPLVNRLKPRSSLPGGVVRVIGENFGDTQDGSLVHIGKKTFDSSSPDIALWTDTEIGVIVPEHKCKWFKGRDDRKQKVWVTVDGIDSNKKALKIIKPDTCP